MALMSMGLVGSVSAQHDDLYFVPRKKKVEQVEEKPMVTKQEPAKDKTLSVTNVPAKLTEMDEDTYNRRGAYLTDEGDAVAEFAMSDEGFVLITEEGDTMWMDTDTLRLTRVMDDEGWVNGFDGSDSDYEYAMRIIRFRNPRYAIPVSSPLYWDVVYGGALWPSWEWNIYDDGMYAYVFPTSSNWHYWDYRMNYSFGWGYYWGYPYNHYHWGLYSGYHYGHVWYDPWFNPYFHGYNPGWHHGHHPSHYPGMGAGNPGWGAPKAYPNHRTASVASTRRDGQASGERGAVSASRQASNGETRRIDNGSSRNSSVRVITGRPNTQSTGAVRSSVGNRTREDAEVVRRSTGTSTVSRSTAGGSTSRTSSSTSSYSRPSSTRTSSSSSSVSRTSSSSSSSRSSYSGSSSSRSSYSSGSSSYSSGSSSRSSYSGGSSSYSSGSSSRSSYSGGSSSYSSGSSSRSSSGSRR